ncbi:MAG: hypothetical protein V9G11_00965 [Bifidobacterium adolescentis]
MAGIGLYLLGTFGDVPSLTASYMLNNLGQGAIQTPNVRHPRRSRAQVRARHAVRRPGRDRAGHSGRPVPQLAVPRASRIRTWASSSAP